MDRSEGSVQFNRRKRNKADSELNDGNGETVIETNGSTPVTTPSSGTYSYPMSMHSVVEECASQSLHPRGPVDIQPISLHDDYSFSLGSLATQTDSHHSSFMARKDPRHPRGPVNVQPLSHDSYTFSPGSLAMQTRSQHSSFMASKDPRHPALCKSSNNYESNAGTGISNNMDSVGQINKLGKNKVETESKLKNGICKSSVNTPVTSINSLAVGTSTGMYSSAMSLHHADVEKYTSLDLRSHGPVDISQPISLDDSWSPPGSLEVPKRPSLMDGRHRHVDLFSCYSSCTATEDPPDQVVYRSTNHYEPNDTGHSGSSALVIANKMYEWALRTPTSSSNYVVSDQEARYVDQPAITRDQSFQNSMPATNPTYIFHNCVINVNFGSNPGMNHGASFQP